MLQTVLKKQLRFLNQLLNSVTLSNSVMKFDFLKTYLITIQKILNLSQFKEFSELLAVPCGCFIGLLYRNGIMNVNEYVLQTL